MYKNKEFDYDLWTTEIDGKKKYWVRVRNTNEVVEVNLETMRFLRNQEKSLFRKLDETGIRVLPYDIFDEEISNELLVDKYDFENDVALQIIENEFFKSLTDYQKEIYMYVFKNGEAKTSFAQRKHTTLRAVTRAIERIRKNFLKNFS